jgi:hypothetical protein
MVETRLANINGGLLAERTGTSASLVIEFSLNSVSLDLSPVIIDQATPKELVKNGMLHIRSICAKSSQNPSSL